MGKAVGAGLRAIATLFYMLNFLISAAILGIFAYYIAKLHQNNLYIDYQWRAIEGLSGAAVLYTMFAILLTCFLGGVGFFAFLGMMFDAIFCGAMIAIAVLDRHGGQTCGSGRVTTVLGTGNVNAFSPTGLRYRIACKLDLAVLIIASVGALTFLISFFLQLLINRHRAHDKYKGPNTREEDGVVVAEPEKRGFFGRRAKSTREAYIQPDMAVVDGPTTSGTTLGQPAENYNNNKYENNKYENHPAVPAPQFTTTTGPNIVSSTTTTRGAVYDPYATPATTGPNGFAAPRTEYVPGQQSNNF